VVEPILSKHKAPELIPSTKKNGAIQSSWIAQPLLIIGLSFQDSAVSQIPNRAKYIIINSKEFIVLLVCSLSIKLLFPHHTLIHWARPSTSPDWGQQSLCTRALYTSGNFSRCALRTLILSSVLVWWGTFLFACLSFPFFLTFSAWDRPRASCMLGMHSTTELYLQDFACLYPNRFQFSGNRTVSCLPFHILTLIWCLLYARNTHWIS
jgi:hypothetical protein